MNIETLNANELAMVKAYFSEIARRGGQSRSRAKLRAVSANLAKARAKRWAKKERGG